MQARGEDVQFAAARGVSSCHTATDLCARMRFVQDVCRFSATDYSGTTLCIALSKSDLRACLQYYTLRRRSA